MDPKHRHIHTHTHIYICIYMSLAHMTMYITLQGYIMKGNILLYKTILYFGETGKVDGGRTIQEDCKHFQCASVAFTKKNPKMYMKQKHSSQEIEVCVCVL
eukprot:GHVR01170780.1.p1 GENE.GHVR01170780.1~~GHVR01170780.1.p1  ORF type:complete len:101 (-),score=26.93 GHVR01170780.1:106-408(-)